MSRQVVNTEFVLPPFDQRGDPPPPDKLPPVNNTPPEVVISVASGAARLAGFRITSQAPLLRHFTARFEPL